MSFLASGGYLLSLPMAPPLHPHSLCRGKVFLMSHLCNVLSLKDPWDYIGSSQVMQEKVPVLNTDCCPVPVDWITEMAIE